MISNTGYLKDSADRFNPFNIIPSKNITMKGVPHPVLGVDNQGNVKLMTPGNDYKFKGNKVLEIPLRNTGKNIQHGVLQDGGENKYIPSLNNRGPSQRESIGEAMWDGAGMALGAVGDVMSIPQRYIMQGLTGKYQDPSQAWGFKEKSINPTQFAIPGMGVVNTNQLRDFSNFAMDTVLDPMNLLGASVIKSMFKGVKSGSIAARGAKSADNFIPKSVIDDGYRNMFQKMKTDPDFISKADPNEVLLHNAENQIKLARNLDASEILSKGDRSIDKGLRDSYEAIKYTDINKLPDSLKKFKGLSFEDYQSHFIKDQPFSQVASKIAPDLEYSPVFRANQEINKPLTDELYNSLRNENINPFKRNIYTENTGNALHKNTVREMNSFESDKIDAVNSFNKVRNETGVIRSGTSDAIDWNALRYKNKNGGEIKKYQEGDEVPKEREWTPEMRQFHMGYTQDNIQKSLEEMGPPGERPERPGLNIYNENLRRPPIDNTIKFPSTGVPGVQGRPEPTTEYESFMPYSMYGLMGLGALNNVLDKRNKQFYDQQMQKYGNTNAMQTNNPENPYGDFTLNNSVGSNFRPNQYVKRGGSVYQEGGEYDLTEEEIHMLQNEGYDVEFL